MCQLLTKNKIIYYFIDITPIIFVITIVYELFIVKLVTLLAFF